MSNRSIIIVDGSGGEISLDPYMPLEPSDSITWDTSTGLNKTLTIGDDFTLELTNLVNGMMGDLRLDITGITTITLPTSNLIGSVTNLDVGIYHLAFVHDETNLDFNIAIYTNKEPSLKTSAITGKTISSLLGTGGNTIVEYGDIQTYAIQYRMFGNTSWLFSPANPALGPLLQNSWEHNVVGLRDGETYEYRAFMTVDGNEYYGDILHATTTAIPFGGYVITMGNLNVGGFNSDSIVKATANILSSGTLSASDSFRLYYETLTYQQTNYNLPKSIYSSVYIQKGITKYGLTTSIIPALIAPATDTDSNVGYICVYGDALNDYTICGEAFSDSVNSSVAYDNNAQLCFTDITHVEGGKTISLNNSTPKLCVWNTNISSASGGAEITGNSLPIPVPD